MISSRAARGSPTRGTVLVLRAVMAPSPSMASIASMALIAATSLMAAVPLVAQSVRQVARSPHGMVVTAQPLATVAGRRILELGGNAIDAAVSTAFAATPI